MGFLEDTDVQTILKDKTLVNQLIKAVVNDPEAMSELTEDVASELGDQLQKDAGFRKKMVEAATSTPEFKKQVIKTLVEEITD